MYVLRRRRGCDDVVLFLADPAPLQITCLYDMDIPRPDNFNETYLYEGR